jgi:hypothetical protein
MIFSVVNWIFLAVVSLVLLGIYGSYCYIGFDAKPLFEEMLEKWKKSKEENAESEAEPTYFGGVMKSLLNLVFIFMGVLSSVIILKMVSNKKPPKLEDFVDILVACLLSVSIAVGLTMAAVRMLPIMGRAFENTVGYMGISTFGGLDNVTDAIFTNANDSKMKYGVLSTKMFDTGFFEFLESMKTAESSPIKGVFLKKEVMDSSGALKTEMEDSNPLFKMFELTAMKHTVSEATWISLATILAIFSGFVMTQYSGIRKKL